MLASLGGRPTLLRSWAAPAITLARELKPAIMRTHGDGLNGYVAAHIKEKLGIPYLLSIHQNPDETLKGGSPNLQQRTLRTAFNSLRRVALQNADLVVPVYQSSIPYVKRMGAKQVEVIYNVVGARGLKQKKDYALGRPIRIISVGRHFEAKNPENIIRAMKFVPNAELTFVGDGPIQPQLEKLAKELDLMKRVRFIYAMKNETLCTELASYDLFAIHVENDGISKTTLEAMLAGLPCIINQRAGSQVPELQGDHVLLVENTAAGYANAINTLIADQAKRQVLGNAAYTYAREHWAPEKMEQAYIDAYRKLIESKTK